jgi:hypothetical protein
MDKDNIEKINLMLKHQGDWAEEYMRTRNKRKLEKGREEKKRVKENKEKQKQKQTNSLI